MVHAGAAKHRMVKNDFTLRPPEPGVVVRVYGAEQADGRHIERQGKMERAAIIAEHAISPRDERQQAAKRGQASHVFNPGLFAGKHRTEGLDICALPLRTNQNDFQPRHFTQQCRECCRVAWNRPAPDQGGCGGIGVDDQEALLGGEPAMEKGSRFFLVP